MDPCSQLWSAADFVTGSNENDGFANAIERIILGGLLSNARADMARSGVRG